MRFVLTVVTGYGRIKENKVKMCRTIPSMTINYRLIALRNLVRSDQGGLSQVPPPAKRGSSQTLYSFLGIFGIFLLILWSLLIICFYCYDYLLLLQLLLLFSFPPFLLLIFIIIMVAVVVLSILLQTQGVTKEEYFRHSRSRWMQSCES